MILHRITRMSVNSVQTKHWHAKRVQNTVLRPVTPQTPTYRKRNRFNVLGVRFCSHIPDAHKILGVDTNATKQELKAAFKKRALECHPDKNPDDPDAAKKFTKVKQAFEQLYNADKKKSYQEQMEEDRGGRPKWKQRSEQYKAWRAREREKEQAFREGGEEADMNDFAGKWGWTPGRAYTSSYNR